MTKSLLLKGLAGVATVAGAIGGGGLFWFKDDIFGDNKATDLGEGNELGKFSHKELIDKVGLSCGLTGKELNKSEDKECRVKDNGALNIKIDNKTEEGVTFTTSDSAKLRVRRSEGGEVYRRELKFVVDSGDISLSKSGGSTSPTAITKLEQFETYEIEKVGDKFYLKRKTKADVGIKNALGLGSFSLPDNTRGETSNSFNDAGEIKKIRFEGHEDGITVSSGEIKLKVAKTVDTTTFPFGYIFNFTFPADVTIKGKQLKGNIPYEFKIKKAQTGNSLTLEQAWTDDNTFTKKAGLDCTNSSTSGCTVSSDSQKLNVKVGHLKREGVTTVTTGKIKMETGQAGYNQGLKFSIDGGNAGLTGGTGSDITKLEELETYEIAEDGGKYYLTKKTSPDQLIRNSLSLPDECKLPTTDTPLQCSLDEGKFQKINFESKDTNMPTGTAKLTISKANSTDFPFGYKFTFETEKETTIKANTTIIKAKIPKDFKIKKGSGTGQSVSLSLEKAWDDDKYSLAQKVGLNCTTQSGDVCCTMDSAGGTSAKLNVKKGSDKKEDITGINASGASGKIKVEKDKEGYNQGLKFTITGGDVSLTDGTKTDGADFTALEELETYEITEDKGKYYLTRKTSKEDVFKSSLSIPENCFTSLGTSCTLSNDQLKNIKFDGKDSFTPTGTATLTVTKANSTDFPLGYRFTLQTEQDITIKSSEITVKKNIPTDFKIKKGSESGQSPTLTLEKAWKDDDYSFAKKAGLTCTAGNGECCSKSSEQLNIRKGDEKKENISSFTAAAGSSSAKIKVEKDQAGYNQGLKFTISGGNITLTGGSGTGTFTQLDEYETYEIKEEGDKYYLTRKDEAIKTIESQLGLTAAKCSLSGTSSSCTLDTEQIKKINFSDKDTTGASMTSGTATLTIAKVDKADFPLGYKFTLKSDSSDITIKNGNVVKAKIPTDFKIKKNTGKTPSLTLEKAWDMASLGKKVGLSCTSSDECSIDSSGGGKLKVRQTNGGQDVKDENLTKKTTSGSSSNAKIKVTKDQEGYNQGFKFTVEGGSIELDGSTASSEGDKINILDEYETYEIKEDSGKWYLTRKHESIVFLKKQLGLDFCSDNSWSRIGTSNSVFTISFNCDDVSSENLKKIKFHNKSNSHSWPTGDIKVQVSISKKRNNASSSFSELEVEINKGNSDDKVSKICIPDGSGGSIDLKGNSGGMSNTAKYKISKGSGSDTLCLVKSGGSGGTCK